MAKREHLEVPNEMLENSEMGTRDKTNGPWAKRKQVSRTQTKEIRRIHGRKLKRV